MTIDVEVTSAVRDVVALSGATTEQSLLDAVVGTAARLCGADHGVALLLGADASVSALAHVGMPAGHADRMPHLPGPVGLLGHVLAGHHVRTEDMTVHPAATGTPFGHFAMKALLGVPVSVEDRVLGGLWLTKGPQGAPFTADDQLRVEAVARQTGTTVASLRRHAAERRLIEHLGTPDERAGDRDRPGQVSPAVRRLVRHARDLLQADTVFLGRIQDGRQTLTVVDTVGTGRTSNPPGMREGDEIPADQTYCPMVLSGVLPPVVPDVRAHPLTSAMPLTTEAGIGAYCGVPVLLPDGSTWGTLCGLDGGTHPGWDAAQIQALRTIAALIGRSLGQSLQLAAQRSLDLASFADLVSGERRRTVVQPIVELATGSTRGFEALSRFDDVTGAPRRPDHVFAEAGRLGVGLALEHAALVSALALVRDLPAGAYLSVNLSPRTIVDPTTYHLFRDHDLRAVVVEMTEHEQILDYPSVTNALDALRSRGARLAIDDTGAGFAGLQHLARLRPDIVKLDMSFVRGIDTDPALQAVARAVASFAAEVGAGLVAEGIETPAELARLQDLGATHGQGYLLGRPSAPGWSTQAPR